MSEEREPTTGDEQRRRPEPGRYAYEGIDRLLHEKARLGIMTSLLAHPDGLLFNDLKELCSLTDGNLSRHLQVLNEAGFLEVCKGFLSRRPQTLCRLTQDGRGRFVEYLQVLEKVIEDAHPRTAKVNAPARPLPRGWVPA